MGLPWAATGVASAQKSEESRESRELHGAVKSTRQSQVPSRQALSARAMPLPLLVGTGNIELRDVHMLCECLCALLDAQSLVLCLVQL